MRVKMMLAEINEKYLKLVLNGDYLNDYQQTLENVKNSSAIYKGKPVPFLYHPMFFTEKDIFLFQEISQKIMSIGNKVINEYLHNETYRKKFGFSPSLEELILIDHGYEINVPIGRFDIFYHEGNFTFCELNTDGSSAMNEDNTIARILLQSQALIDFQKDFELSYFECIEKWVDECMKIYHEYDSNNENPTVAIVDFMESATHYEFQEFKKAFEKKGYQALICDITKLKYIDNRLYYEDKVIDLVYRRAVTKEIIDRIEEVVDFINAYKNNHVCVIGPFKSQILHNKIIFKILHDDDTLSILTDEEREFVSKHIPYTGLFSFDENVYNEVLENKDKYILKPLDLYGSRGVYAGIDYDNNEWKEILVKCFNNDYIYQEYVIPYERNLLEFENNRFNVKPFKTLIGLFIYNEKFAGLYTRVGKNAIISGLHGYYTVPNILVKKR